MKIFIALFLISSTLTWGANRFYLKYDHKLPREQEPLVRSRAPYMEYGIGYGARNFVQVDECGNSEPVCGVDNISYRNRCDCKVLVSHVGKCYTYNNRSSYFNMPDGWMVSRSPFKRGYSMETANVDPFYY